MNLSSICRRAIISQETVGDKLVTVFDEDWFPESWIGPRCLNHPAGTLVCDPVTDNRGMDDESVYSATCTRLGKVFWDEGTFTQDYYHGMR